MDPKSQTGRRQQRSNYVAYCLGAKKVECVVESVLKYFWSDSTCREIGAGDAE